MRSDDALAARVAADIPDGSYVNLGIGLPQLIADMVPSDREVMFHSENGVLGIGAAAAPGQEDWECVDAGKRAITVRPGGSFFHHADSFSMIRGGHLDIAVLGAYEVSATGDLANWWTGSPDAIPGVGGAMDLVTGAKMVYVIMHHATKDGSPRMRERCRFPLTARGVVSRVYTDLCVAEPRGDHFEILELAPGVTPEQVCALTEGELRFPEGKGRSPERPFASGGPPGHQR